MGYPILGNLHVIVKNQGASQIQGTWFKSGANGPHTKNGQFEYQTMQLSGVNHVESYRNVSETKAPATYCHQYLVGGFNLSGKY